MSMMISELYDALINAGATDEKARAAASAAAAWEDRFSKIATELLLIKWMLGFNLTFSMAILWKVFS